VEENAGLRDGVLREVDSDVKVMGGQEDAAPLFNLNRFGLDPVLSNENNVSRGHSNNL
jgi:hypothetical protein